MTTFNFSISKKLAVGAVLLFIVVLLLSAKYWRQLTTTISQESSEMNGMELTVGAGNLMNYPPSFGNNAVEGSRADFTVLFISKDDKYGGTKIDDATYRDLVSREEKQLFQNGSAHAARYLNMIPVKLSNYCPAYPAPQMWVKPFVSNQPGHYVADDLGGYFIANRTQPQQVNISTGQYYYSDSFWRIVDNTGFLGSHHVHLSENINATSSATGPFSGFAGKWTLPEIEDGKYDLYVTWTPASDLSIVSYQYNADKPVTLPPGVSQTQYFHALKINQTQNPNGPTWDGRPWQKVGLLPVEVDDGRTEIFINASWNSKFVADAIRLVPVQ